MEDFDGEHVEDVAGRLGFGASVYRVPDNQIVIPFRGTDTKPMLNIDWVSGNVAALGRHGDQVRQAIEVVGKV